MGKADRSARVPSVTNKRKTAVGFNPLEEAKIRGQDLKTTERERCGLGVGRQSN